jgi:hypothetical protein
MGRPHVARPFSIEHRLKIARLCPAISRQITPYGSYRSIGAINWRHVFLFESPRWRRGGIMEEARFNFVTFAP